MILYKIQTVFVDRTSETLIIGWSVADAIG